MSHAESSLTRRKSIPVSIGPVTVGGDAPIVVQSMTNTDTADAVNTVRQITELAAAGSELVRITVNSEAAAAQVAPIKDRLLALNCEVPLVGDFHFNGHKLLTQYPECAEALSKYRINPGNVGKGKKRDTQYASMIEMACQYEKPIRIGVNWGSLDQDLLVEMMDANARAANPKESTVVMHEAIIESALKSAERALDLGIKKEQIIISCKMSGVQDLISIYRDLAAQCHYALHLGLTE